MAATAADRHATRLVVGPQRPRVRAAILQAEGAEVTGKGEWNGRSGVGIALASTSALLPGRLGRDQSHAVGPSARRQGLLRYGLAPPRIPRDGVHHQPGAQPAGAIAG